MRITAYIAEPNLVNTARPHTGKLFRVYTLANPHESALLWGYLPKPWLVGDVFNTLERHALLPLMETFSQAYNTNRPVPCDKMKVWPSGAIFDGNKTYERYAEHLEKGQGNRDALKKSNTLVPRNQGALCY